MLLISNCRRCADSKTTFAVVILDNVRASIYCGYIGNSDVLKLCLSGKFDAGDVVRQPEQN